MDNHKLDELLQRLSNPEPPPTLEARLFDVLAREPVVTRSPDFWPAWDWRMASCALALSLVIAVALGWCHRLADQYSYDDILQISSIQGGSL